MIVFPIVAGLLLACAMAFILVPLTRNRRRVAAITREGVNVSVYKDQLRELEADLASGTITQARHDEAVSEIERRLLEDTSAPAAAGAHPAQARGAGRATLVIAMTVPFLAATLYFVVGTPQALVPGMQAAAPSGGDAHGPSEAQVQAMIEKLAERMKAEPDNPQGWAMLGRSYAVLGRFAEASEAYGKLVALVPNDAQLLADYADVLAMAQGRTLEGEPEKLIARALAIDPANVKALALAGSAAFAKSDYKGALARWGELLRVAPPGSELAASTRESMEEAKTRMGASGAAPPAITPPVAAAPAAPEKAAPAKSAAAGASVSGVVEVGAGVAAKIAPTDTLFIFARAVDGPRMPVAIIKAQAKDLPLTFTLDDRSSMMGGGKLSDQPRVIVGARVSKSGSATPQPGDLQGYSAPVAPGASGLRIVLTEAAR
ncbi:MAG TPA: c-type cytochrome biogenesis protein CcmI [Burkholderiales bacterium]|nr:c-type cytochrome biogenesis protein CcmI [Burkholderiales bacterium]